MKKWKSRYQYRVYATAIPLLSALFSFLEFSPLKVGTIVVIGALAGKLGGAAEKYRRTCDEI